MNSRRSNLESLAALTETLLAGSDNPMCVGCPLASGQQAIDALKQQIIYLQSEMTDLNQSLQNAQQELGRLRTECEILRHE